MIDLFIAKIIKTTGVLSMNRKCFYSGPFYFAFLYSSFKSELFSEAVPQLVGK